MYMNALEIGLYGFEELSQTDIHPNVVKLRKRKLDRELSGMLFMKPSNMKLEEMQGRISGDMNWRLARGEISISTDINPQPTAENKQALITNPIYPWLIPQLVVSSSLLKKGRRYVDMTSFSISDPIGQCAYDTLPLLPILRYFDMATADQQKQNYNVSSYPPMVITGSVNGAGICLHHQNIGYNVLSLDLNGGIHCNSSYPSSKEDFVQIRSNGISSSPHNSNNNNRIVNIPLSFLIISHFKDKKEELNQYLKSITGGDRETDSFHLVISPSSAMNLSNTNGPTIVKSRLHWTSLTEPTGSSHMNVTLSQPIKSYICSIPYQILFPINATEEAWIQLIQEANGLCLREPNLLGYTICYASVSPESNDSRHVLIFNDYGYPLLSTTPHCETVVKVFSTLDEEVKVCMCNMSHTVSVAQHSYHYQSNHITNSLKIDADIVP
jgi:hypothetical protein